MAHASATRVMLRKGRGDERVGKVSPMSPVLTPSVVLDSWRPQGGTDVTSSFDFNSSPTRRTCLR